QAFDLVSVLLIVVVTLRECENSFPFSAHESLSRLRNMCGHEAIVQHAPSQAASADVDAIAADIAQRLDEKQRSGQYNIRAPRIETWQLPPLIHGPVRKHAAHFFQDFHMKSKAMQPFRVNIGRKLHGA